MTITINRFAFGAAGYCFDGAEHFAYRYLVNAYKTEDEVFGGQKEELLDALVDTARASGERFDREQFEKALVNLRDGLNTNGCPDRTPIITIDEDGTVLPNEHFGLPVEELLKAGVKMNAWPYWATKVTSLLERDDLNEAANLISCSWRHDRDWTEEDEAGHAALFSQPLVLEHAKRLWCLIKPTVSKGCLKRCRRELREAGWRI